MGKRVINNVYVDTNEAQATLRKVIVQLRRHDRNDIVHPNDEMHELYDLCSDFVYEYKRIFHEV